VTDRLHIVFGTDTPYAAHLTAALRSLRAHTDPDRLVCHILHDGMDKALRERIGRDSHPLRLEWTNTSDLIAGLSGRDHFSRSTYHRLTIPQALNPGIGRAVYLDSDIVIHRDILPLGEADLGGAEIAAVTDAGETQERVEAFAQRWSLGGGRRYFNAGVLVMDLERLRRSGSFTKALELSLAREAELRWLDQDALNITFWDRWKDLDPIWNVQAAIANANVRPVTHEIAVARGRIPAVVHFTGDNKPWKAGQWTPYAALYWRALSGSSFEGEVRRAAGRTILDDVREEARWMRRRIALRQ
jgi:lipopolysaccharide biosynthesis glycosyltransferase